MAVVERQAEWSAVTADPMCVSAYEGVTRRLMERYGEQFAPSVIHTIVARSIHSFAEARITTYVPILVERRADAELRLRVRAQDADGERS